MPVRRGLLLLKAFPEVVPGTTFQQSLLGQASGRAQPPREPARPHSDRRGRRSHRPGGAGPGRAGDPGASGCGAWARPLERTALAFGLGTAGLGVLTLLAGRAGLLSPWLFRVGLGSSPWPVLGVSRPWTRQVARDRVSTTSLLTTLVVAPFLVIMLLGSMLPAIDFDVLEYHLQGPKEYYQAGRITFLPHNVYTNMPFGVEMLHLLGMEVLGDWWWGGLVGQLLVALYAPAAAV